MVNLPNYSYEIHLKHFWILNLIICPNCCALTNTFSIHCLLLKFFSKLIHWMWFQVFSTESANSFSIESVPFSCLTVRLPCSRKRLSDGEGWKPARLANNQGSFIIIILIYFFIRRTYLSSVERKKYNISYNNCFRLELNFTQNLRNTLCYIYYH